MISYIFRLSLILLCSIVYRPCDAKILIMVPVFNRPEFIDFQCRAFKKFLLDEYELLFFNDANTPQMQLQIEQMCEKYGVTCVRVPQTLHDVDPNCHKAVASFRHGEVLQFAFENYGFKHNDIVATFDSDMFLINPFSIREYLGENDLNSWNGHILTHFGLFNVPKLLLKDFQTIKFRARYLPNGEFRDVGHDATIEYISPRRANCLNIKQTNLVWGLYRKADCDLNLDPALDRTTALQNRGYSPREIQLICSLYEVADRSGNNGRVHMDCNIALYETNIVLDYKHGSGWHGPNESYKNKKDSIVTSFLNDILN